MKCPYRKRVAILHSGINRVIETRFMECDGESCPYYGVVGYIWHNDKSPEIREEDFEPYKYGCRKAENECYRVV